MCWQLNTVGVKPASEYLKKPLTEKHQTNATAVTSAVPAVVSVPHSSSQPAAVASDANISTLSLVSVGPYEEFAVSIVFCVCFLFISRYVEHLSFIFHVEFLEWLCYGMH